MLSFSLFWVISQGTEYLKNSVCHAASGNFLKQIWKVVDPSELMNTPTS